ncbi:MAG: PAS domain S-box protein [Alphaproteobacteria bacterium]|nr:PAS domain S-box protein [Alphaproteobacteria bacterium]
MNRIFALKQRWSVLTFVRFLIAFVILFGLLNANLTQAQYQKKVTIGVIAHGGEKIAQRTWVPTAKYLNNVMPQYAFSILPVSSAVLASLVNSQDVDFIIVDPGALVEMENSNGVLPIATLIRRNAGRPLSHFGGVVFTRSDNDKIQTISDLSGVAFAGASKRFFGGYQMILRELKAVGLNPTEDFSVLKFGGYPPDNVVDLVSNGYVDAGAVRTGVLEKMAAAGEIDLHDFRILRFPGAPSFELLSSTRLYSEWAFARLQTTNLNLARRVSTALFQMASQTSGKENAIAGWTVSSSYPNVKALMAEINIDPVKVSGAQQILLPFEMNWLWLVVAAAFLLLVFMLVSLKTEILSFGSSGLTSRGRLGILTLCMTFVVVAVLTTTCVFLYQVSLKEQKERLQSLAQSQAALIESIALFDERFNVGGLTSNASNTTIRQIQDSFDRLDALGAKEELVVASRAGKHINIDIASHGLYGHITDNPKFLLVPDGPMRKALSGLSGVIRYIDGGGRDMLAAYEHIPSLNKGLVAQVNLSTVRQPFLIATGMSMVVALIAIAFAVFVFRRVSTPVIDRLEGAILEFNKAQSIARIGNWEWDIKTDKLTWSDEVYRIFGEEPQSFEASYSASEGKSHPDDLQRLRDIMLVAIREKSNYEIGHRIILSNGAVRHVIQIGEAFFDANNEPIAMLGTIQDVTEQMQFQNLLSDAINTISDGFAMFDADEQLITFNQPYLDSLPRLSAQGVIKLGVSFEEMLHAIVEYNFLPKIYTNAESFIESRLDNFRNPAGRIEYEANDGRWFWFEMNKTSNGSTIVVRGEITARKKAELAVKEMNENLEDLVNERTAALRKEVDEHQRTQEMLFLSEQRHRAIVNTAADGIITIDQEGIITSFNNAAEKVFGWSVVAVIGKNVSVLMPALVSHQHDGFIQNFIDTNEAKIIGVGREVMGLRKNGEEFPMDLSVSVSDVDDNLMFTGIVRDISERKEADLKLRETLERLQQTQNELIESGKMASLGGLVAGIAHEINTPVGIGVTAASHLQDISRKLEKEFAAGKISKTGLKNFLESAVQLTKMILSNLTRAADLIRSFKQVAVDQSSGEHREFKVGAYLDEVMVSLAPQIRKSGHKVMVECDDAITADSDPGALAQIVTNLVMNSIIHGFPDQSGGEVRISVLEDAGSIELKYTDNGRGMDEKTQENVFEPFFTTRRGQGGSGLGMNIVFNLVTQTLRGVIRCKSTLGEGVEFIITFPSSLDETS